MDGNGRWAKARGLPRTAGHQEGLKAGRRVIEAAAKAGVRYLTLYVFSTENWKRSQGEVDFILGLAKKYLLAELEHYFDQGLRLRHAGDLDGLPADLAADIRTGIERTRACTGMQVVLALNYGGRDEICRAIAKMAGKSPGPQDFSHYLDNPDIPDPDLIIRTAGERRLSNFLLWEAAYSEFYISPKYWPDWTAADLDEAIADYEKRQRRYGGL
jgi:undecaprenyl diphosphate synthase